MPGGYSSVDFPDVEPNNSDCFACEEKYIAKIAKEVGAMYALTMHRFIVCSQCGNKRCPKATWHGYKCTDSNEAGQYGSIYGNRHIENEYETRK